MDAMRRHDEGIHEVAGLEETEMIAPHNWRQRLTRLKPPYRKGESQCTNPPQS